MKYSFPDEVGNPPPNSFRNTKGPEEINATARNDVDII